MQSKVEEKKKNYTRYDVLYFITLVIISIIIIKLLYLQVYKYSEYKEKANTSSLRFIAEETPRGEIIDSKGNVLAENNQTYVISYMQTEESQQYFYSTMRSLFQILSENNEEFLDTLLLSIDENGKLFFDFQSEDQKVKDSMEFSFKRDRGLSDLVKDILYKNKKGDLNDAEINKINEYVLKISPEETFYYLINQYQLYELLFDEDISVEDKSQIREKYLKIESKDKKLLTTYILRGKSILEDLLKEYTMEDIRKYVVIKDLIKMESYKGYKSVDLTTNINRDTAFIIYQQLNNLPGINIKLKPVRYYPYGNLASSIIGYISPISSSQKEVYELQGYDVSSDLVGAAGIEYAFENYLKGNKGGTTIRVNSSGRQVSELFKLESFPGNNIHLTIDKDIQYAAQESLKDIINSLNGTSNVVSGVKQTSASRGATVAIEVNTGRILALASYPDFDPNIFSIPGSISNEESKSYFSPNYEKFYEEYKSKTNAIGSIDDLFPYDKNENRYDKYDLYPRTFFNYATQGLIPPGSSFKPLTAVAGLEEGVITPQEIIDDTGVWNIHSDIFKNYAPTNFNAVGNGKINVEKALEVSSNFFFYETAFRLYQKYGGIEGLNIISKYAYKFGLGADMTSDFPLKTGIEIDEKFGQVYNFTSFRNQVISYSMFTLVDYLKNGKYGSYTFIPLDIEINEQDSDELSDAKKKLKDDIKARLMLAGTDDMDKNIDVFSDCIKKDIDNIMKTSEKYKEEIENLEKVDLSKEVDTIASAIVTFVIFDQANAITSPAEVVNAGIGQGMSRFTPVQLVNYIATLANGGTRYNVRLVDKITSYTGEVIEQYNTKVIDKIDIDPITLQTVKNGMYAVNHNDSNSFAVQQFNDFPIDTAGKTGTADLVNTQSEYDFIGRYPFATYGGFAPVDKPEIATFTVIYDGGRGSYASYPAKAIYEAYFKELILEKDPDYANKSKTFRKYILQENTDTN